MIDLSASGAILLSNLERRLSADLRETMRLRMDLGLPLFLLGVGRADCLSGGEDLSFVVVPVVLDCDRVTAQRSAELMWRGGCCVFVLGFLTFGAGV